MKKYAILSLLLAVFSLTGFQSIAQTTTPEGYTAGKITLASGTTLEGFVKENFKKKSCVSFIDAANSKKKTYEGWDLNAASISGQEYICLKGDFYTVLASGELYFLQKATNAEGKIAYNGTDPVYQTTTEGKAGDYYVYNSKTLSVSLVNKASYDNVIATQFSNYQPAIEKAKEGKENVAQLKGAVDLYNKRPAK